MKKGNVKNNSILFNILTLLSFGIGLFLIIFLRQRTSKESEQSVMEDIEPNEVEQKTETNESLYQRFNDRQRRILDRISQEGRMDPNELYALVPNVSTRTVRRDMDVLIKEGIVTQEGSTKATTYIYKG